jgi:hypothetical protein
MPGRAGLKYIILDGMIFTQACLPAGFIGMVRLWLMKTGFIH